MTDLALIVVDMQRDFMPGGALPVAEGDRLVQPVAAHMLSGEHETIVATQDWHPPGHASFASGHPGRRPLESIELHGHPQTLWPDHCVQGTPGAELHPGLPGECIDAVIRKGTDADSDSYSGIRNNWNAAGRRPATGLAGYLRARGVCRVQICGLARDYCCKWTAEDAAAEGFDVHFLWNLTRPVDLSSDSRVRADLEAAGITIALT